MAHPTPEDDPRRAMAAARQAEREERVRAAERDDGLVWHYTDGAGLIAILRSHTVWATSSGFLNDQFEVALGLELVASRVRQLAVEDGNEVFVALADRLDAVDVESFSDLSPARFFILSASRAWDSLAMWRNYGGVRESYAVGLDAAAPLAVLAEGHTVGSTHPATGFMVKRQAWRPVAYTPQAQRALVDAVFDEMPDQIAAAQRTWFAAVREQARGGPDPSSAPPSALPVEAQELLDELEQALLLVKHVGFTDERETRYSVVVWEGGDPSGRPLPEGMVAYRQSPYGIAPYVRLTGPTGDPADGPFAATASPLPVRAVAISPSPNGSVATDSVTRLLADCGYGDVPVLRSGIPFRSG